MSLPASILVDILFNSLVDVLVGVLASIRVDALELVLSFDIGVFGIRLFSRPESFTHQRSGARGILGYLMRFVTDSTQTDSTITQDTPRYCLPKAIGVPLSTEHC